MDTLPDWVLRRLRDVPGLEVSTRGRDRIEVLRARRGGATFRVQPQGRVGTKELEWLLSHSRTSERLIATHALSSGIRDDLANARVSWVERDTGVVHLDTDHLFVHVEPSKPPVDLPLEQRSLNVSGITSIIAEALLDMYRDRPFTLREMAERTGATKSRVSQVFSQLVGLGILHAEGQTRTRVYELRDPSRILDEWARSGPATRECTTHLYLWSRTPADVYRRLGRLNHAELAWALGGPAAAHLYTPTLSVLPTPSVWVQADTPTEQIAQALDAEIVGADETPNLTIWQAGSNPALVFRSEIEARELQAERLWVVSRPRAYVEARAAGGRGVDVAEALREEIRL